MNVYLAASFGRRDEIARYGLALARRGITVTSRWLTEDHEGGPRTSPGEWRRYAREDLEDIDAADVVVCFTHSPEEPPRRNTGGRHVELGYALAKGKRVVIVGPAENVFHYLVESRDVFRSWAEACARLGIDAHNERVVERVVSGT